MATNLYFDWATLDRFVQFDTVRSSDANAALDLVTAGFDKMPTPSEMHGGYANYAAATGAVNTFAVALDAQVAALVDGLEVRFKANLANTGVATLNVNALGAKIIVRPTGNALEAGDIALNMLVSCVYDATNDRFQLSTLSSGGAAPTTTFSGTAGATIDLLTGANIASAATVNLNTATGNRVHITGTTNITAVTLTRGPREVIFDGILTLTHHATNNNLPGGANITTAAGDRAVYGSDGTTVYCMSYTRASGLAITAPPTPFTYDGRTSNVQLTAADFASSTRIFRDITSGTFTQTFVAAATIGAGGWVRVRNSGTGDITLDPNGAETIDGLTSFIMYPGEVRDIYCDGSTFRSVVVTPFSKVFTSTANFIKPPGYNYFGGTATGGGGGGGKGGGGRGGAGGGGGGTTPFLILASLFAASTTITIAAGGAGSAVNGPGSVGGNTTIGSLVTGYGGGGGGPAGGGTTGGSGGGGGGARAAGTVGNSTASSAIAGGAPNPSAATAAADNSGFGGANGNGGKGFYGGGGGQAVANSTIDAAGAGSSMYGGGGGGAGGGTAGAGGTSTFAGNGSAGVTAGTAAEGSAPGGGGGGADSAATAGGIGGRGEALIYGVV